MTAQEALDKYYKEGSIACRILVRHSRQVADMALEINRNLSIGLDPEAVEEAAMLHDIGVFMTDAPGIGCHGSAPYICHGILGADLLRREGFSEQTARVAERHTGAGITASDIEQLGLPLPADRVLEPQTELERLVCYADKFYSKSGSMERKSLESVRQSMARHSAATAERFEELHRHFSSLPTKEQ